MQRYSLVDLGTMFRVAARRPWHLLACAMAFGILFGVRAYFATPIYRTDALVSVVIDADAGAREILGGSLGTLASLAGIDLGGQTRRGEYLAFLKSKGFIRDFIVQENLMPILFAGRWDADKGEWRNSIWFSKPTLDDGVERFFKKVFRTGEDRKTGLVTISIEWRDRELSARWLSRLIEAANGKIRGEAITEAEQSLQALDSELKRTTSIEIQQGIYKLVEANLKRKVLAKVQSQFAFKIIDPPSVPDKRRYVRPNLVLEALLGALLGALTAIVVTLWRRRADWWPVAPQPMSADR